MELLMHDPKQYLRECREGCQGENRHCCYICSILTALADIWFITGSTYTHHCSCWQGLFGAATTLYILRLNAGSSVHKRDAHEKTEKQAKVDGSHASPQAAESTNGQFADVFKTEVRPAQSHTGQGIPTPSRSQQVTSQHAPAQSKPEFQNFMSGHLERPPAFGQESSLYDALPLEKTKVKGVPLAKHVYTENLIQVLSGLIGVLACTLPRSDCKSHCCPAAIPCTSARLALNS